MAKYIAAFLLIFGQSANSAIEEFRYYSNAKYISVKMVRIERLRVNELCLNKNSCSALQTGKGPPRKILVEKAPTFHNPAASYCWDVGAKNRILKDAKNNEYDFCVFDDSSMIDAWNLYTKHYPPKRVK